MTSDFQRSGPRAEVSRDVAEIWGEGTGVIDVDFCFEELGGDAPGEEPEQSMKGDAEVPVMAVGRSVS